jgi:hypothetical protein
MKPFTRLLLPFREWSPTLLLGVLWTSLFFSWPSPPAAKPPPYAPPFNVSYSISTINRESFFQQPDIFLLSSMVALQATNEQKELPTGLSIQRIRNFKFLDMTQWSRNEPDLDVKIPSEIP